MYKHTKQQTLEDTYATMQHPYTPYTQDKEKTMALLAQVQNTLFDETRLHAKPLFEAQWPQRRVQQVPQGRALLVSEEGSNEGNPNSAAIVLFQVYWGVFVRATNTIFLYCNTCGCTLCGVMHSLQHLGGPR